MIVVDASVGLPLVAGGPGSEPLWKRVTAPETTLHVPHLFDIEVLHGLRRSALRGLMADARLARAVALLEELQAVRYPHDRLLRDIWRLRHTVSAYDGAYCALARALDAPLVTLDTRLARSGVRRVRFELLRAG